MKEVGVALAAISCLLAGPAVAESWPHYRGPDYNGIAPRSNLPQGETFGFEIDWITALGSGYSSISVVGDTGVTMFTDGTSNVLLAFDSSTGKERWHLDIGPVYKGHSGSRDGPTSTPAVRGGMVYALDPHGRLVAVTLAEGEKLWDHRLGEDVRARVPHYGFSTSPVVLGDKVIVMTGDQEGSAFTAFAAETGKLLWHAGADTTTYQSPFVWQRGGEERILALTDRFLMELDPGDGRVLWQQEHTIIDNESFAPPVLMSENELLIMHRHEMAAHQLTWNGDVAGLQELWRNPPHPQTYCIPIYHQGYLYYYHGQILTCLDAQSGERVWRSRPPGGRALILADGYLLTVAQNGDLVAVSAAPEGYGEKARLPVFDEGTYTPVSVAHGYVYLRNLKQMARVKITDQATVAAPEAPAPRGVIAELVTRLQEAPDAASRTAVLDDFMEQQQRFPIVEGLATTQGSSLVHFVYRGDIDDIALVLGMNRDAPLSRVEGTGFYYRTEELDSAGHWEYHFSHYDEPRVDPLNPLLIGTETRMRNELRMPEWPAPDFLHEPTGARGRLESFPFTSETRGNERTIEVYLPAGYDGVESSYPLLLVTEGDRALEVAKMDVSLDNLIGTTAAPVIVAFVPADQSEVFGDHRDAFVRMATEELVPHLDASYRTETDPATRGIMGAMSGAVIASYTALKAPGTFGKLALQTFFFWQFEETLTTLVGELDPGQLAAYVEISSNDFNVPGFDAAADSRKLIGLLRARDIPVKEQNVSGAPSWGSWRAQTGIILGWFAPPER